MDGQEYEPINKCPYCKSHNLIWLKEIESPHGQLYRCWSCKKKVFVYDE